MKSAGKQAKQFSKLPEMHKNNAHSEGQLGQSWINLTVNPAPYGVCLGFLHNQFTVTIRNQRLCTLNNFAAKTHFNKRLCVRHVVDGWCQAGSAQDGVTPVAG